MTDVRTEPIGPRARRAPRGSSVVVALAALVASGTAACVSQKDFDAKSAETSVKLENDRQEIARLRTDLAATRERLENALRVNADSSTDLLSAKQRATELAAKAEDQGHSIEELKKDLSRTRSELDSRIDEIKRAQAAGASAPPPVAIPPDKAAHFAAVSEAFGRGDWALTRTLGREYQNRYSNDDKVDDVSFMIGDADLKDGRPSTALGELNKVLRAQPPSNVLDKALFSMGEAYLTLHDCQNARLAFETCAKRYPQAKTGQDSKSRMATIDHPQPGTCAPQ